MNEIYFLSEKYPIIFINYLKQHQKKLFCRGVLKIEQIYMTWSCKTFFSLNITSVQDEPRMHTISEDVSFEDNNCLYTGGCTKWFLRKRISPTIFFLIFFLSLRCNANLCEITQISWFQLFIKFCIYVRLSFISVVIY